VVGEDHLEEVVVVFEDLLLDVGDPSEDLLLVVEALLAEDILDHVLVPDLCLDHLSEEQENEVILDHRPDHEVLPKRVDEVPALVVVVAEVQVLLAVEVKVILHLQKKTQRNKFSIFTIEPNKEAPHPMIQFPEFTSVFLFADK